MNLNMNSVDLNRIKMEEDSLSHKLDFDIKPYKGSVYGDDHMAACFKGMQSRPHVMSSPADDSSSEEQPPDSQSSPPLMGQVKSGGYMFNGVKKRKHPSLTDGVSSPDRAPAEKSSGIHYGVQHKKEYVETDLLTDGNSNPHNVSTHVKCPQTGSSRIKSSKVFIEWLEGNWYGVQQYVNRKVFDIENIEIGNKYKIFWGKQQNKRKSSKRYLCRVLSLGNTDLSQMEKSVLDKNDQQNSQSISDKKINLDVKNLPPFLPDYDNVDLGQSQNINDDTYYSRTKKKTSRRKSQGDRLDTSTLTDIVTEADELNETSLSVSSSKKKKQIRQKTKVMEIEEGITVTISKNQKSNPKSVSKITENAGDILKSTADKTPTNPKETKVSNAKGGRPCLTPPTNAQTPTKEEPPSKKLRRDSHSSQGSLDTCTAAESSSVVSESKSGDLSTLTSSVKPRRGRSIDSIQVKPEERDSTSSSQKNTKSTAKGETISDIIQKIKSKEKLESSVAVKRRRDRLSTQSDNANAHNENSKHVKEEPPQKLRKNRRSSAASSKKDNKS